MTFPPDPPVPDPPEMIPIPSPAPVPPLPPLPADRTTDGLERIDRIWRNGHTCDITDGCILSCVALIASNVIVGSDMHLSVWTALNQGHDEVG